MTCCAPLRHKREKKKMDEYHGSGNTYPLKGIQERGNSGALWGREQGDGRRGRWDTRLREWLTVRYAKGARKKFSEGGPSSSLHLFGLEHSLSWSPPLQRLQSGHCKAVANTGPYPVGWGDYFLPTSMCNEPLLGSSIRGKACCVRVVLFSSKKRQ